MKLNGSNPMVFPTWYWRFSDEYQAMMRNEYESVGKATFFFCKEMFLFFFSAKIIVLLRIWIARSLFAQVILGSCPTARERAPVHLSTAEFSKGTDEKYWIHLIFILHRKYLFNSSIGEKLCLFYLTKLCAQNCVTAHFLHNCGKNETARNSSWSARSALALT